MPTLLDNVKSQAKVIQEIAGRRPSPNDATKLIELNLQYDLQMRSLAMQERQLFGPPPRPEGPEADEDLIPSDDQGDEPVAEIA